MPLEDANEIEDIKKTDQFPHWSAIQNRIRPALFVLLLSHGLGHGCNFWRSQLGPKE